MPNKHHLTAGHYKVNETGLVRFVEDDSPKCTGNKDYLLCSYAKFECKRDCFATESLSCQKFKYLSQYKSTFDKFGANYR